ncbi:DUF2637 domain-containing protein [Streptomyces sp. ME19-01-6]|uniref:DUF2637 domain-containing protein n=1 Tax=Streptomyces sp. ME19-01-6 TaxID=3028686 RepID=UPI0029B136BD|nr:DUF2637 domain-containing protein [Streptomyces sp. ME19-01-6]MDX3229396.1 DUF2637 domain-containing protein [Streptomyces sp. ME19-01-6]
MTARFDARHGLAVGAALATVALTAAAFWLSYEHLHDTAAANGLGGVRAWAWPATIDMFIVVGELLMLRASLARHTDPWAIGLTSVGSLGSIALNVAGVGTGAKPLEYIVAAVPPVAALLAFGALMRQVHQRLSAPDPEPAAAPGTSDTPVPEPLPEPEPFTAPLTVPPRPGVYAAEAPPRMAVHESVEDVPPELTRAGEQVHDALDDTENSPGEVPEGSPPRRFDEHVEMVRNWLATEPELTGTAIGERLGTSDGYGRRVRRAALAVPVPS